MEELNFDEDGIRKWVEPHPISFFLMTSTRHRGAVCLSTGTINLC